MPPWKQDQEQFVNHIGVGDVEVVLECGHVHISSELVPEAAVSTPFHISHAPQGRGGVGVEVDAQSGAATHILLDVFLALLERRLAELGGDLGGRVVHELAVRAEDVAGAAALLLVGVAPGAGISLRLRGAWRGRR